MKTLDDKIALITGANLGGGHSTVKLFAEEGSWKTANIDTEKV